MDILADVLCRTENYMKQIPKKTRKAYGQFFTGGETANYMASLLAIPENKAEITVLDPGAGSGILTAALIQRLLKHREIQKIHVICYETDPFVRPLLTENLRQIEEQSSNRVECSLKTENYITSQTCHDCEKPGSSLRVDMVIGNPPYRKLPKDAPEALSMPNLCHGVPNLYFLFAAMSLSNLKDGGEMVYIMPRSWTSGAYFHAFRRFFLYNGALEHIHLFLSRDHVFDNDKILQETMILRVKKSLQKPREITVTTTEGSRDFSICTEFHVPYGVISAHPSDYVYLTANQEDTDTLKRIRNWKDTLPDLGLRMKTGLTVDFRNQEALRSFGSDYAVPLFYSRHIQNGKVIFPAGIENEYIQTRRQGLLQPNVNYLFVKRFTTKEERRRLQCGIYLAKQYPHYRAISTQNKLNYITGSSGLSESVVYGLYVLLNSTLYDHYYRILDGSTQVNSTEINAMPVPPLQVIQEMGNRLIKQDTMSVQACDSILEEYL